MANMFLSALAWITPPDPLFYKKGYASEALTLQMVLLGETYHGFPQTISCKIFLDLAMFYPCFQTTWHAHFYCVLPVLIKMSRLHRCPHSKLWDPHPSTIPTDDFAGPSVLESDLSQIPLDWVCSQKSAIVNHRQK